MSRSQCPSLHRILLKITHVDLKTNLICNFKKELHKITTHFSIDNQFEVEIYYFYKIISTKIQTSNHNCMVKLTQLILLSIVHQSISNMEDPICHSAICQETQKYLSELISSRHPKMACPDLAIIY